MSFFANLCSVAAKFLHRSSSGADLEAELRSHIEHRADDQAEDHENPRDRQPYAGRLGLRLGVRRLVLRGIGHQHGGTVGDLDGSSVEQPRIFRLLMNRSAGAVDQIPD